MQRVGPNPASPFFFVLFPNYTTLKNLLSFTIFSCLPPISTIPIPTIPMPPPLLMLFLTHLFVTAATTGQEGVFGESQLLRLLPWVESSAAALDMCSLPQKSRRENAATILEMRHHGYCSNPTKSWKERTAELMASDEARVRYLQSKAKPSLLSSRMRDAAASAAELPVNSGTKLQTLNYIVTVELGGKQTTVIVDTGSDLTWIQCKPCDYCYNQQDPLFDPSASKSYQPIPCGSPTCTSLLPASGGSHSCGDAARANCNYSLHYGDGSYSTGELAHDRIGLGGSVVEGFIFGCGRSNRGLFGGASGLMGLGRTQLSIISQTEAQFSGIFSYCLPSKDFGSSGSLVFGGDHSVSRNTTPISYTKMMTNPQMSTYYLLNLTGMSIGGVELQVLRLSNGKIMIDSGTVITRLAPSVYRALRTEFLKQFSQYPSAPAFSILDTCFDLSGHKEVNIPTLKLTFEGEAEITVDVTGMLYFVKKDASQVCLALTSLSYEDQLAIIGNYQQKNLRVVYDTMGSRIGFARESCSYS